MLESFHCVAAISSIESLLVWLSEDRQNLMNFSSRRVKILQIHWKPVVWRDFRRQRSPSEAKAA